MTDVAAAVAPVVAAQPPAAAPAAAVPPVEAAAAPAAVDPVSQLAALVQQLTAEVTALKAQVPAPPAVEIPVNPPSPVNLFQAGQMVKFAWADPYDGPSERIGLVVHQYPDEGQGAQSAIAWFDSLSGPIGDHQLTAV